MVANVPLIEEIARQLQARGWRMSTVESCTGGLIAQQLTALAGSSEWFECGWVTYSNDAKIRDVGVNPDTLKEFGAVSEQTAAEMAAGASAAAAVMVSLSVTGVAGPSGGSLEKPVGTVCFGWQIDSEVNTEVVRFDGDRKRVREQSANWILETLLAALQRCSA